MARLMNTAEAARRAGVCRGTVQYWIRQGYLEAEYSVERKRFEVEPATLRTFLRRRGKGERVTIEVMRFRRRPAATKEA